VNAEIAALVAGEPAAFARLYDRLGGRLLAAARLLTGSGHEAEDAVQDLFVAIARGRDRLAAVSDLDAYLFTALRHTIFRRRRQAAARRITLDRLHRRTVATSGPDGPVALPAATADDDLAAAVASLPPEQRDVVLLRTRAGLSFAEIAATLGVSLNTAASRWRYALEKLRVALTGDTTRPRGPANNEVPR
jgi:RNA polymerase sigma-70 factor (ECF subfamily)